MARPRNPKRDVALRLWLESNGKKKLKDIAVELELSDTQIRKWKNQDKWDDQMKGNVTKSKSNVTKRARGAPAGNKNAAGHGPPKGNQNAKTHGFFSRYVPKETLEIMGMLEDKNPADLIWDQIMIQYAAIIRAQEIMFVESKDEMIKELKKEKDRVTDNEKSSEREWEFQFAWDRQATFLNAQSRAMSELRSLIKQFNELAHDDDERRLKLELMQSSITKVKAETAKITGDDQNDYESDGFIEALDQKAVDVWNDFSEDDGGDNDE